MYVFRFASKFGTNIQKSPAELRIIDDNDMKSSLLEIAEKSLKEYNFQYVVAASDRNGPIFAWFNNQAIHSAALALNLVHNAFIQSVLGDVHSIRVFNSPFKMAKSSNDFEQDFIQLLLLAVGFTMSLLSGMYISFYIKVRSRICYVI